MIFRNWVGYWFGIGYGIVFGWCTYVFGGIGLGVGLGDGLVLFWGLVRVHVRFKY